MHLLNLIIVKKMPHLVPVPCMKRIMHELGNREQPTTEINFTRSLTPLVDCSVSGL